MKLKSLIFIIIFVFTAQTSTSHATGIPVVDGAQLAQWILKNVPLQAIFNQKNVRLLKALKEFAPEEYSKVESYLRTQLADEFYELVGLVNDEELVFSFDSNTNSIYHNSLKEHIKTAVMAQKAYNSASGTQNTLSEIASKVVTMFSQTDREIALINSTTETASSINTLTKLIAQQIKQDSQVEAERYRRLNKVAAGQINRETRLTSIGCKPRDLPCIQRKVTEMANESALGGIGGSASSSSAVGDAYLRTRAGN